MLSGSSALPCSRNWKPSGTASRSAPSFARKSKFRKRWLVAKPAAKARFRRIAGSVDFEARRLGELPAGITLEAGRLEVRFAFEEDLWYLLDQLADIAAQDGEAFRGRVEPLPAAQSS